MRRARIARPAFARRPAIERASAEDMMILTNDVGPVPMQVGAILLLGAGAELDLAAVTALLAERIAAVPRLRQRLVRTPAGRGRPFWADDQAFDIGSHVRAVTCAPPGDEAALLETAVSTVTRPLPWSRPLWSATLVTGLAGSRSAVVVVFHHVLADGIGGLAVLASLVDGVAVPAEVTFPGPAPTRRQLAVDALGSRLTAVARALRSYLARQDERLDHLVASVMVAGRASAGPALLGNVVGVMPVRLPTGGERGEQLARISALTRARKTQDRGASAGLLRPAFGILAVLGLLKWFINHQRMVNVFVTNLRGPDEPQRFAGAVIADLIPITLVTGNVTLSFAVLSYAGSLAVVAIADRDAHRDLDGLVALLQAELDALTGA